MEKKIKIKVVAVLAALIFLMSLSIGVSGVDCADSEGGVKSYPGSIKLISQVSIKNRYGIGAFYDMQLTGDFLYIAGYGADPVFDISNPFVPFMAYDIDFYSAYSSFVHRAIKMVDGVYYALGAGPYTLGTLEIWDLSSQSPRPLGVVTGISEYAAGLDVVLKNKAYTVSNIEGNHQSGLIDIWDISNPGNIISLGSQSWSEYPWGSFEQPSDIVVEGDIAYIGTEGVRIYSVANNIPTFLSKSDAAGREYYRYDKMQKIGSRIFKVNSQLGILVFDVSNPQSPFLDGLIGPPTITLGGNIAFKVVGNKLFVATAADQKLKVFDITDIMYPVLLASKNIGYPSGTGQIRFDVEVDGRGIFAFVASGRENGWDGLLNTFRITYPYTINPVPIEEKAETLDAQGDSNLVPPTDVLK